MDIDVFPSKDLPTVFRVLRTALRPSGMLDNSELRFLHTYARITGYPLPHGDPAPTEVGRVWITGAHQRKRLIQLAAMAVLLNRPLNVDSVGFLKRLARWLQVKESVVDVVEALAQGKRIKARMLSMQRGFRAILKEAYTAEGWRGIARFLGAMFLKTTVNKDKVWDYKRLGLLPEGTLGREYWKHMAEVGFGFPGESGGIPESVAYHDIAHVLTGNDTTPLGEIQQGSFQGGNRREDGFFFIQFVILQFHHGVQITPMAPPQYGNFHPDKVLWAIHRGARCTVDLTHQWNYWPLMKLKLEQARATIGLLPKLRSLEMKKAA
jgi:hypothetical protein